MAVLHEWDAGAKTAELVRRHGVTEQTLYRWRKQDGGLPVASWREGAARSTYRSWRGRTWSGSTSHVNGRFS